MYIDISTKSSPKSEIIIDIMKGKLKTNITVIIVNVPNIIRRILGVVLSRL